MLIIENAALNIAHSYSSDMVLARNKQTERYHRPWLFISMNVVGAGTLG